MVGDRGLEPETSSLLPDEIPEIIDSLVGLSGLEPETSSLSVTRSNQLSYRPIQLSISRDPRAPCPVPNHERSSLQSDYRASRLWCWGNP